MDKQPSYHNSLSLTNTSGHPQTVAIFQKLAEGFNVEVKPDHTQYWRSMLTVARALDTLVDTHTPTSIQTEARQLVQGVPIDGITKDEAQEFSQIFQVASPERQAAIQQGLSINDYAIAMRQATTYSEFVDLRVEEAELFGHVMQLDNPNEHATINTFNTWLPSFARAGYLIDSFGDFSSDYKEGIIGLEPTVSRRIKLGKRALSETFNAGSQLPPRTIAFLAAASLSKMARNGLRKK